MAETGWATCNCLGQPHFPRRNDDWSFGGVALITKRLLTALHKSAHW